MTLFRWTPSLAASRDVAGIQDEVNRLIDGFLTRAPYRANGSHVFVPAVDVEENAEGFRFRVDLPGMSQKDVKVSITGDVLTIRGERKREGETDKGERHRVERVYGAFERSFTLGAPVRADQVKATYRDGVLEIQVPKADEARQREIEVQVG